MVVAVTRLFFFLVTMSTQYTQHIQFFGDARVRVRVSKKIENLQK